MDTCVLICTIVSMVYTRGSIKLKRDRKKRSNSRAFECVFGMDPKGLSSSRITICEKETCSMCLNVWRDQISKCNLICIAVKKVEKNKNSDLPALQL